MPKLIFRDEVDADCWVTLLGDGTSRLSPVLDPPAPLPAIRSGPTGIAINARCSDFGKVKLEIWAGDPGGLKEQWTAIFNGDLEALSKGLRVGSAYYPVFRLDVSPGRYRVRAEVIHDRKGYVDAVRFIFPESGDLQGEALNS
jgi:hypothetical protein